MDKIIYNIFERKTSAEIEDIKPVVELLQVFSTI